MLNLYYVCDDNCGGLDGGCDLYIWAESEQQAIDLWWIEAGEHDYNRKDEEHYTITANHRADLPAGVEVPSEPKICEDKWLLRHFGYQIEGDKKCCSCGLYEMDGAYPVCNECDECAECAARSSKDGDEPCKECCEDDDDEAQEQASGEADSADRNELARLRAAHGHMQQEINILRQRESGDLITLHQQVNLLKEENADLKKQLEQAKESTALARRLLNKALKGA